MIRFLSADILIADIIVDAHDNASILQLMEKYALQPGGKQTLDDEQLAAFLAATESHTISITPGGSSANMLTSLHKILSSEIKVNFLGIAGEGTYSGMIRKSLKEADISLLPGLFPTSAIKPQTATSFVFLLPGGQRTIATHPGNARHFLKPALIAEHLVEHSDVLLVQGSLWHKFQVGFVDRIVKLGMKHRKQLWLTLPTQANLTAEETELFLQAFPHASLILGNETELVRIFNMPCKAALQHLQKTFREHLANATGINMIAFITLGEQGAAVVTAHGIEYVSPGSIEETDIVSTLGAGDTAFAGFAAGYIKSLPNSTSAHIAMALATEKLRIIAPRLENPLVTLKDRYPDLAQQLLQPATQGQ